MPGEDGDKIVFSYVNEAFEQELKKNKEEIIKQEWKAEMERKQEEEERRRRELEEELERRKVEEEKFRKEIMILYQVFYKKN